MNEKDKDKLIDSHSDKIHSDDSPLMPTGQMHV
jgi:hypothetical protein